MSAPSPGAGVAVLRAAGITGAVAALVGAMTLAGYAGHIGGWEPPVSGAVVASVVSRAILVAVETIFCLVFSVLAFAGVARPERTASYAGWTAAAKALLTLLVIGSNWDGGWYYILDPQGAHPSSILLLVASAAQAILLVAAGVKLAQTDGKRTG